VGFLIVFSMLVQSVLEALKNFFKFKTGVWERFFIKVYSNEFSLQRNAGGEDGWVTSPRKRLGELYKREFIGDVDKRMERINRVVVKGDNLIKTIRTELEEITRLAPGDKQIPLKAASAMGNIGKLFGLRLHSLLCIYDSFGKGGIKGLYDKLEAIIGKYPEQKERFRKLEHGAIEEFQQACEELLLKLDAIEVQISQYRQQIENKLDAWLVQVDKEYSRNMLLWTIIIGLAFVFITNADSFTIYRHLSLNPGARTELIKRAGESLEKIERTEPEQLNEIDNALRNDRVKDAMDKINIFVNNLQHDFALYGAGKLEKEARNIEEAGDNIEPDDRESAKTFLSANLSEVTILYTKLQRESIESRMEDLNFSDLPLGWSSDWKLLKNSLNQSDSVPETFIIMVKKILRLLLTTFLISFGAPFWNDILSTLVGIKNISLKRSLRQGTQ
jgi:hypothetical protein